MIIALAIGIISLIIAVVAAPSNPDRFFHSYLFSYMFWIDLPLGAIPLLMMYQLTGGTWGAASRRIFEAAARTMSWMALFFLPVLFGMKKIYPWLAPDALLDPKIAHKSAYLNIPGFCIRAVFYFLVWILLNHFLQRWSSGVEKGADIKIQAKARSLSAGGLVAYALTATFASFDWQMSLDPHWYSTIYGMVYCTSQGLSAFSFGLIVFVWLCRRQENAELFPKKTRRDLGRLLLAMVMVWAYLSFMQFLVVWMGNLPEEATWFVDRTHGGWQMLGVLLIAVQFALPFGALLFRGTKDHLKLLGAVAALVFILRIVDRYWTIMPSFYHTRITFHWQVALTFVGIGGLWLSAFLRQLRLKPLFAHQDTDWPEADPHV